MARLLIAGLLFHAVASAQSPLGSWAPRSRMLVALTEVAAAPSNGKIYVVGGIELAGRSTKHLQIYDPFTDTWTMGPPVPIDGDGIDHANFAAAGGKLYVLGGLDILRGRTINRTFEFDPATSTWAEKTAMPTLRGAAGVAELNGKIYVAGGQRGNVTVAEFAVFDPAGNGSWLVLPPMPTPRNHLTAQALDGKLYAIGGRSDAGLTGVVEVYDPQSNSWTERAPMLTPRSGIASATLRGRIQVLGGEISTLPDGTFRENEEYDPARNTWQALTPLAVARHGISGVTLDRRIYTPGGGPVAGLSVTDLNDVFFFPPERAPEAPAAGLVDGAGFRRAVAAGGIASIFGTDLADAAARAIRFPLPGSLFEAGVLVNGQPAPLFFVSPTQINLQLPFNAAGAVTVQLVNAGRTGSTFTASVGQVAPGIFSNGVVHGGNHQPVNAAAPAARGEVLAVFCSGLGPVAPAVETGRPAASSPLSRTTLTVTAAVGGVSADVQFAGLAPGFAGLYQVNVAVPQSAPMGNAVPVVISVAGVASNTINIPLR